MKQTLALLSIFLIFSYNSNPFILGIRMSIIKRSYIVPGWLLYFEITSAGSLNVSTEANPFVSKTNLIENVISGSSSTTRILLIIFLLSPEEEGCLPVAKLVPILFLPLLFALLVLRLKTTII